MPRTRGWALSDDEAYDVAAYINSKPRADFSGKSNDWPKGEKPEMSRIDEDGVNENRTMRSGFVSRGNTCWISWR